MSAAKLPQDAASPSLAEAATATDFFERTRIFERRIGISLGEALARHAGGLSFKALGVTATVRNYTLENVVLDADLILFQNGCAIPETAYFEPPDTPRFLSYQVEPAWLPSNEDLIFGYNNAHRGYQHWLSQCLPAIDWSLRQKRTREVRLISAGPGTLAGELPGPAGPRRRDPNWCHRRGSSTAASCRVFRFSSAGATSFAVCLSYARHRPGRIAWMPCQSSGVGWQCSLYPRGLRRITGRSVTKSAVTTLLRQPRRHDRRA